MSLNDEHIVRGSTPRLATSPTTACARHIRHRRLAAERLNLFAGSSRSNESPPPLSPSPSPPGSPLPALSMKVPHAVQTSNTGKSLSSKPNPLSQTSSVTRNRNSPTLIARNRPPIVSPVMPQSPSKSWDEGDDRPTRWRSRLNQLSPVAVSRVQQQQPILLTHVQSDLTGTTSLSARYSLNPRFRSSGVVLRSICDDANPVFGENNHEDSDLQSVGSRNDLEKRVSRLQCQSSDHRPPTPTNTAGTSGSASTLPTAVDDDVSSLGGVEDCLSSSGPSLMRIVLAIKNNSNRPSSLTFEEKALWDAVQVARRQARMDGVLSCSTKNEFSGSSSPSNFHRNSNQCTEPEPVSPSNSVSNNSVSMLTDVWESRCQEAQELAIKQQKENSRSLRAIQRVLADVQAERDKAVEQLLDLRQSSSGQQNFTASLDDTYSLTNGKQQEKMESLAQELESAKQRIRQLENELHNEQLPDAFLNTQINSFSDHEGKLKLQLPEHNNQEPLFVILPTTRELQEAESKRTNSFTDDLDRLQKEVAEKGAALENAKMIITSLENASNAIAADLRAKLRSKDDECMRLKRESAERQKTLDTLATELRDLQCSRAKISGPLQDIERERSRRLTLSSRLEKNMAEILAASVIVEATQDPTTVHSIANLLSDSIDTLKEGIDVIEDYDAVGGSHADVDSAVSINHDNARLLKNASEAKKLRRELEDKKKYIKQLENEVRRVRAQCDVAKRHQDEQVQSLHAEIRILRQQCSTNMEVLTRKERELVVLRDSLQVEDVNVGYISDDNSEADDEDNIDIHTPAIPPPSTEYGPSQAEALATLLARGGNHSFDSGTPGVVSNQIELLKIELAKVRSEYDRTARELKVEKESLSNAKMIISSLERANKSMMEDLRSRLQDSNSAIACLLEKSLESEKTSSRLRAELADALQRERDRSLDNLSHSHALIVLPVETID